MTHEQTDALRWLLHGAVIVAVVTLLSSGCATFGSQTGVITEPMDGQAEAMDIVWRQVYHRPEPPPRVAWHTVSDCTTSNGAPGFKTPTIGGNGCATGVTPPDLVAHVLRLAGRPISSTSFSHELWHVALAMDLAADPLHITEGWRDFSQCALESCVGCLPPHTAIVQRADAALLAAGK